MAEELPHLDVPRGLGRMGNGPCGNAILKHQSQAESAPFLGDDERLFWQRAEDRNRATAELYHQLGLASYEAMEAFVQYVPVR